MSIEIIDDPNQGKDIPVEKAPKPEDIVLVDTPEDNEHWLKTALLTPVGAGEAALSTLSGGAAAIYGGWSGISRIAGDLISGGIRAARGKEPDIADLPEQATKALSATTEAMTYEPRTKSGKFLTSLIQWPLEKWAELAEVAGAPAAESTRLGALGPYAGTAISTALLYLPMHFGPKAIKSLKRGQTAVQAAETAPIQKWSAWREFWQPFSTLSDKDAYLELRYKGIGKASMYEQEMLDTFRNWKKKYSPEDRKSAFEYLDGRKLLEDLPENLRADAEALRLRSDEVGAEMVKRGIISEDTFNSMKGHYVHYLYLKDLIGKEGKVLVDKNGKLRLETAKKRGEYSDELRRAWGWVEDAGIAAPVGLLKSLRDIVRYDFFQSVAEHPMWTLPESIVTIKPKVSALEAITKDIPKTRGEKMGLGKLAEMVNKYEEMTKEMPRSPEVKIRYTELKTAYDDAVTKLRESGFDPKAYAQLPTDKHYGALAGTMVHRSIYRDVVPFIESFRGKGEFSNTLNKMWDWERKTFAAFKVGKVALNVPTMSRNVISNMIQLNMSGIPIQEIPGHIKNALQHMVNKTDTWKLAQESGIFGTNWGAAEIGEVLSAVNEMKPGKVNSIFPAALKLAKYYGKIDDVMKFAKFLEQQKQGVPVGKSVIEAQKWGMDYSIAHPAIKVARRNIIPFITYQYKIAPLILETLQERPWIMAKYALMPFVMRETFRQQNDMTNKQFERVLKQLPSHLRNNPYFTPMLYKDNKGQWQWGDLEYFFPWQNFTSAIEKVQRGSVVEAGSTLAGIGNPVLDFITALRSARGGEAPLDPFTGRPIWLRTDTGAAKAAKTLEWIYNRWAPSMLTRYGALGTALQVGGVDPSGATITPGKAGAKLFGLNVRSINPVEAVKQRKAKETALRIEIQRIMRDQSIPIEQKRSHLNRYVEERLKLYKE